MGTLQKKKKREIYSTKFKSLSKFEEAKREEGTILTNSAGSFGAIEHVLVT